MKLRPLLLAASLLGNAALLTLWLTRTPSPATPPAPALTPPAAPSPSSPVSLATIAPAALRDHLRALGLPPAAIDALVRSQIYARHDARRRELLTAASQSLPWWQFAKRPPTYDPSIHLTRAERKELADLAAEARAATLATLGPAALDPTGSIAARYAFLSPEKAVLLEALEQDYRNLNSELRDELGRVRTAADREREKLLATERQRDLAALLSPSERDLLDQQASPTASRLAARMRAFNATEEEYRAIYAIQKSFDQQTSLPANPAPGTRVPSIDNQPEFTQKIRAALGDARFADWEFSTQPHVRALADLAVSANLPPPTIRDLTALLTATAASSWKIVTDNSQPPAQRSAALAQLAAEARTQVAAQLGADIAAKYLRDVFWFDLVANGAGVNLTGGGTMIQSVGPATPPPTPPTPGK